MKKIFLISLISTALFTSCSDEVINTLDGNTIRFDNAFVELPETRATDITTENLTSFYVHGWMTNAQNQTVSIFDKVEVARNSAGAWTYQGGGRYWFADTHYEFLAFAPLNAEYTLAADRASMSYVNKANYDLLFAAHQRSMPDFVPTVVEPVRLTFEHMLSKVLIQFKNDFTVDDVRLDVSNLQLTGLARTATLNFADTTWTTTADRTLALTPGFPNVKINRNEPDTSLVVGTSAATEYFYLIPEQLDDTKGYTLRFDVTVWQGPADGQVKIGTYKHTVLFDDITFERGKQYRLSARLNSSNVNPDAELQPITFTVEVMPWGEDIESEVGFPGSE